MNGQHTIRVTCVDVLKDNQHVYARKARRKKIALVRIEATNPLSRDVQVLLGTAQLTAAGQTLGIEPPPAVLRSLSEFTWDFLLYSIVDFHPIAAAIDVCLFLTGPIYNRRLRRQLALLSDRDMVLHPGESKTAIAAFRGACKQLQRLNVAFRCGVERGEVQCALDSV